MLKNILVHLDGSPKADTRLALAQQLALRHEANLTALYGVLPSMMAATWAVGEALASAASLLADLDREQRERAYMVFKQASRRGPLTWLDGGDSPYWTLQQRAPYADLLVLGQTDREDALTGALPPGFVADAISDTGKPTLIVPPAGSFEAIAKRVLIAWKPSREASRAVNAALPMLHLAKTLDLASRRETDDADVDHAVALEGWLRSQGVSADIRRHELGNGEIGPALLSLAADTGADLLVMGCYGHSRAREWVAGGASRSILETTTLPVLMVH